MEYKSTISEAQLQFLYEGYCSMPLLWEDCFFELRQFDASLEANHHLSGLHIKQNKRLGKLAEDLFSEWLNQSKRFQAVFENLQIIEDKRTIGEIDVLLFDTKNQKHIHLELVTKFYLYNPVFDANDIRAWIGPNRNDSLLEKVTKLKQKQLPLLYQKTTQNILANCIPQAKVIAQKVMFKANLFVPLHSKLSINVFNTNCIVGNYVTFLQFKELHNTHTSYFCPTKQDWLRQPKTQNKWNDFEITCVEIQRFIEVSQSLMVWVKYNETFQRYIVVPYAHF